ncbi:hypothetical protein ABG768_000053 [Culter alburnus]|uniref:Immunoglobulin domain-containing protein n=1 Tax=Culter alburnus TaxID=194366 RepID=A0AAW2B8K5_CULAL
MINALVWFCLCLCRLVDVTDAVKTVSVMEGDSVTLNIEVQKYLLIMWRFGNTRIAEVNRLTQTNSTYDGPDGRFRDRLKLDQTGSLTVTNTRTTDSGLYTVTVISKDTKYMSFNLTVNERSSSSNRVASSFVVNNSTVSQTENNSDHICCDFTEAVIRLAVSALVGMHSFAI